MGMSTGAGCALNKWTSLLALLPLALMAGQAHALYVGAQGGRAVTDVTSADVDADLAASGINGTASVTDATRNGWKAFLGYRINETFSAELGYTQLGDIVTSVSGTGFTTDQLTGILPISAHGGELALLAHYPLSDRYRAFARAGVWRWRTEYQFSDGTSSASYSGTNGTFGLGLEADLSPAWSARLGWDRYHVRGTDTNLYTVGLVWRGNGHSAAVLLPAPAPQPVAKPEPVAAAAAPTDSDNDGVADASDQCPDTVAGTKVDGNGCDLRPTVVLEGVNFITASAELMAESRNLLERTAASLKRYPELRIEVAGYSDSIGGRAANIRLSQRRAESVRNFLISHGVAAGQLTARGFGPDNPIADNATASGRARNRRVELHIQE